MMGYTCDMGIYLGKNQQNSRQMMTAAHATVRSLTGRVERVGHKVHMGNFFSSPESMTCTQEVSIAVGLSDKEC
jgi:hypothetical protein